MVHSVLSTNSVIHDEEQHSKEGLDREAWWNMNARKSKRKKLQTGRLSAWPWMYFGATFKHSKHQIRHESGVA